ncbi:MAG: Tyrosine-specific transport protein [Candidatus Anoxychlamydiales bacterium]|nr:Tyrosine-specific transport protein [Candidatus Anoxychlamydiales bacterium]
MKTKKFGHILGGSLLVAGTSIGAGMLALPVVTSLGGFWPSILIYLISYVIMTISGFLYLEIALAMPKDSNIISMSDRYLGNRGKVFSWIIYLFLFYFLSVAYISVGGNLIKSFSNGAISSVLSHIIYVSIFGFVVYRGALLVDRINMFLMIFLGIGYFLFIFLGFKHVEISNLKFFDLKHSIFALPVILLSFGYQGIMPTLTYYMKKDVKKIKASILLGTTMALVVYIIWEMLILGIIPIEGAHGLKEALKLGQTAIEPFGYHTNAKLIFAIGQFFSFFVITTSFLGVSLGLFDFIADGFKIEKKGMKKVFIAIITFLPPTIITMFNPNLFLIALGYAGGIGGILLLVFLPALMVYSKRYVKKEKLIEPQLKGGKTSLYIIFVFVVFELFIEIINEVNRFLS